MTLVRALFDRGATHGRKRRFGRCLGELLTIASVVGACGGDPRTPEADGPQRITVASPETPAAASDTEAPPEPETGSPSAPGHEESNVQGIDRERVDQLNPSQSTSVGAPNDGHLEGGIALPSSGAGFVSNPLRPNPEAYFGTVEMVRALVHAAASVHQRHPGSRVKINDLGFEQGGPIPHHGSHRAGRDVDVLFFLLAPDGQPRESKGVPIDPQGRGWDFGDLVDPADDVEVVLDVPRTWQFIRGLLEHEGALVQRIFVVEHVRSRLLTHARNTDVAAAVLERFEQVTCQPGTPHDDHLHIRLFCTSEDLRSGCLDSPPMYPWRVAQLRADGLRPAISRGRRARRRSRRVTRAEAREAAGPMHSRVTAFLDRREAWADKPHPGRPYCR